MVDLERRYRKEREYRDTLTSGAMSTYEVDLTEDTVKYLDATWVETLGMAKENGCSYSELVREAAEKVVSEEYREKMRQVFEPQSLLAAYQAGQRGWSANTGAPTARARWYGCALWLILLLWSRRGILAHLSSLKISTNRRKKRIGAAPEGGAGSFDRAL